MARFVVCWFMLLAGLGVNVQYQFVKQLDKRYGGGNLVNSQRLVVNK